MREILFKAKRIEDGEWIEGYYQKRYDLLDNEEHLIFRADSHTVWEYAEISPETICQFTGLCDKNGNKIWENDILMCHENPEDLVKVAFGEFGVRDIETGSIVDKAIGWYYEVVQTDVIIRCEPFCWSMPLNKYYIDRCEMKVVGNIFDNKELLQEETE
nr:MAG TPA: YopX protein [Caudoviricetes sp.]